MEDIILRVSLAIERIIGYWEYHWLLNVSLAIERIIGVSLAIDSIIG